MEETINLTYSTLVSVQEDANALTKTLNQMAQALSSYTTLAYVNIALTVVLILILVYVANAVRKIRPEE